MSTAPQSSRQAHCHHQDVSFIGLDGSQTCITCEGCRQTLLLLYHRLPEDLVQQALRRRSMHREDMVLAALPSAAGARHVHDGIIGMPPPPVPTQSTSHCRGLDLHEGLASSRGHSEPPRKVRFQTALRPLPCLDNLAFDSFEIPPQSHPSPHPAVHMCHRCGKKPTWNGKAG